MPSLFDHLQNLGFKPRKISTVDGGEYSSACPACGDGGKGQASDRFHIWPEKETGGLCRGRFWCRQCDISGDTIAFLQKFHNMDFKTACMELGIVLPNRNGDTRRRYQPSPERLTGGQGWVPKNYGQPGTVWMEKAGNLLADCQERLKDHSEALSWLTGRGISGEIARAYGLGYNVSSKGGDRYRPRSAWGLSEKQGRNGKNSKLWIPQGWVIPAFDDRKRLVQLRIRRRNEDIDKFGGNIKYLPLDGSSMATMVLHPEAEVFVVVECGFDAILLAGLLEGKIGAVTTWNSSARPDRRTHALLSNASLVINGLDYDAAGNKEQGWWQVTYRQHRRLDPPAATAKDPGEAYEAGVDIRQWVIDGLPRGIKIKLGYDRLRPAAKKQPKKKVKEEPQATPTPLVIEMKLSNGKTIYLTDDQDEWQKLTDQGKPVFSRNELKRLQKATASMNAEERLAAAMQAIDTKEIFGGYIRRGESFVAGDKT
ncbi:hypothetical protein [Desulforhopalus singaporensis]|uniref:Zinc-binding domain of primase-helicase n=1 Tax=Desulforhopalus singaporensis TaxID=91360 RepID=A0A1H0RJ80_9BACT|nr:hypothetical protein [Desulforhopalus singaporensis]SDP29066.1 hypothetical protein SAMN05660330_02303 [Desulforhopalus singaporensis]